MKTIIPILTFVLLIFFASCSSVKDLDGSKALTANSWKLKTMNGNELNLSSVKEISLVFDKAGKISGFGGCNNYFGTYTSAGDMLTFSDIGSTKMACDDMGIESNYFNLIKKTDKYKAANGVLTLYSSGSAVLLFEKKQ
jgi:heat shock protein HslJ